MTLEKTSWYIWTLLPVGLGLTASIAHAQQWTPLAPPAPRVSDSAVFDPNTETMIVFGGSPQSSPSNLDDVWWLIDADGPGLSWLRAKPTGTPPAPRQGHSAVYDPASNRMTVFGGGLGRSSPCADDVWVLENANGAVGNPFWVQLSPTGTAPAPRMQHSAVYDPNTNSMIIYGGQDCFSTDFGDVWVLSNANGTGGTPVWTQLLATGGPPAPRYVTGAAYDPTSNRMIIFGGESNGSFLGDVWVLSNANGSGGTPVWTQLSPTGSAPGVRAGDGAVYDATNNRMTIFGGFDGTNLHNDTWVLSNANGLGGTPSWTQLTASRLPSARTGAVAVYNSVANKMTIFGGEISLSGTYTNGVFVLNHANGL